MRSGNKIKPKVSLPLLVVTEAIDQDLPSEYNPERITHGYLGDDLLSDEEDEDGDEEEEDKAEQ